MQENTNKSFNNVYRTFSNVAEEFEKVDSQVKKDSTNPDLYIERAKVYAKYKYYKYAMQDAYNAIVLSPYNNDYHNLYFTFFYMKLKHEGKKRQELANNTCEKIKINNLINYD